MVDGIHHERGWELPGGRIEDSESVEVAALRELKEEADISGKVVELLNLDSLDSGIVAFVEIDDLEKRNEWESQDSKIQRVSFHEEIPEYLYWGTNELKSILDIGALQELQDPEHYLLFLEIVQ